MNDQFLYRYRITPRPEFAAALYRDIAPAGVEAARRPHALGRRLAFGAAALCLALGLVLAASPVAQAMAVQLLKTIGVMRFEETDLIVTTWTGGHAPNLEIVSLEEAQAGLPFPLRLPTWLPEGFSPEARIQRQVDAVPSAPPGVSVAWNGPRGSIHLSIMAYDDQIQAHYEARPELVGENGAEEVIIKGQPAALLRGAWSTQNSIDPIEGDPTTLTWDTTGRAGSLIWVWEGVYYVMFWISPPDAAPLTAEEALQIAESIP